MSEDRPLFERYFRSGVLVDTNLLLLFVVGSFAPERIPTFGRTSTYSKDGFILLVNFLKRFRTLITTPHLLTEVSNLGSKLAPEFYLALRALVKDANSIEIARASKDVVGTQLFLRLGLADAAIGLIASQQYLVLTADSVLASHLNSAGVEVADFNVVRAAMGAS